ncbi:AraC family transcriptional regulator [Aliamphritea ceti]|uniref:AraC family transcriptional regulator n=1 Tax=Aliamphritea ceti TaxID=1524258 RepID=UPI0021C44827|nr:AraC family transcriptional regulator [Aliamphritea ceti]
MSQQLLQQGSLKQQSSMSQCSHMEYLVFSQLDASKATLEQSVDLGSGVGAAVWSNAEDFVVYEGPAHHTLSCYLDGGYDISRSLEGQRMTGGAPGKVCVMPQGHESSWDVSGYLRFFHLYFDHNNLAELTTRIWDREHQVQMPDLTFEEIAWIDALCRNVIMPLNWEAPADRLTLSSAADMLMTYLLQHYARQNHLPDISGGLAPHIKRQTIEYMHAHLEQGVRLEELAELANLSSYHFSRMFKQSLGEPPHRYMTELRLQKAEDLVLKSQVSLKDVALQLGFNDQSHFGKKFKLRFGVSPAQARRSVHL